MSINFPINLIVKNDKFYAKAEDVDKACEIARANNEELPYITINGKQKTVSLQQSWEDMAGMYEVKDFVPVDFSQFIIE